MSLSVDFNSYNYKSDSENRSPPTSPTKRKASPNSRMPRKVLGVVNFNDTANLTGDRVKRSPTRSPRPSPHEITHTIQQVQGRFKENINP